MPRHAPRIAAIVSVSRRVAATRSVPNGSRPPCRRGHGGHGLTGLEGRADSRETSRGPRAPGIRRWPSAPAGRGGVGTSARAGVPPDEGEGVLDGLAGAGAPDPRTDGRGDQGRGLDALDRVMGEDAGLRTTSRSAPGVRSRGRRSPRARRAWPLQPVVPVVPVVPIGAPARSCSTARSVEGPNRFRSRARARRVLPGDEGVGQGTRIDVAVPRDEQSGQEEGLLGVVGDAPGGHGGGNGLVGVASTRAWRPA